jgi:hypothetical protein
VIEAALAVHDTPDDATRLEVAVRNVEDGTILAFDHVDNRHIIQPAGVVRLAAGGRVERGLVEDDCFARAMVFDRRNHGLELGQVGISVVEALGHSRFLRTALASAAARTRRPP